MMKLCILIPIHNESRTIGKIVASLRKKGSDVLVIDDGSTDGGGELAREKGAIVLRHPQKEGKGRSLREGFAYILQKGYEGVITMDGDGQHAVDDVDAFLELVQSKGAKIINGTRMKNPQGMPFVRFVTNKIMSFLISSVCRQSIPDTQCGFRYLSREVLEQLNLCSCDFEIETEVLIEASHKGHKIYSLPIRTIYQGETSKVNPFIDTFRFLIYFIKVCLLRRPSAASKH